MQYPNPLIPGFSPDPSVALVDGVDPDLAWDDDGTAYVTCSGLSTSGEQAGRHLGIQRVIGLYASQGTVSFAGFRYRGGSSS